MTRTNASRKQWAKTQKPSSSARARPVDSQLQSRLMQLPREIRDQIYACVFYSTELIYGQPGHPSDSHRRCHRRIAAVDYGKTLALLRTCRRICSEIANEWLAQILFRFENLLALLEKLAYPSNAMRCQIRRVQITGFQLWMSFRDDDYIYLVHHALKLLPCLQLDRLTVIDWNNCDETVYKALDTLDRYRDGWKELHFIVRHSEFLGYKQARFDDVDSEDGRESEESGDSVDDEASDDSNDSSDSQDDDMIDDTCLLRQPQPGPWQAALEHWERAGLRSRSQPKPQPSVVIYRSTSPTDDAVLEQGKRTRLSQSYGPGQNAKTYGKVKDTALMAPGERDRETLVVVKRGSGVDYAEAVRPTILQPEMGSDLRCYTNAWTWDEAKKVAKTTMVGEMRSMYAMQM
ncbi:hypothetical protein LTR56_024751 [Elasticomyces elasticus]|nr:hypothetical protein LTR56_024751 [Elasticomyces elasticus]KAK3635059.1 hypothetical protein LTR22_019339 [Elasticomyces elasticus]KAK4903636.1 hypothetical protein LTR49_026763 [Elasticomyces elasticus]KAK5759395.1 hypothetical protein LTS12_010408 [Elasticomyces elasticus]